MSDTDPIMEIKMKKSHYVILMACAYAFETIVHLAEPKNIEHLREIERVCKEVFLEMGAPQVQEDNHAFIREAIKRISVLP